MLRNILAKTILSISALLLGSTIATSSWAMDPQTDWKSIPKIAPVLSELPPEHMAVINIGHGLIYSKTSPRRVNETPFKTAHIEFLEGVKLINPVHYDALVKSHPEASGTELVTATERNLPQVVDIASQKGVYILPITSRSDPTVKGPPGKRTENEFEQVKYGWENWKKPVPLENKTVALMKNKEIVLKDDNPDHGEYRYLNGIIYSFIGGKGKPHKSAALLGLVNLLKKAQVLPTAIHFIDGEEVIKETHADLQGKDLGVPLYLYSYKQPHPYETLEDIKEFYIHRLGADFHLYEDLFNKAYGQQ